jgi:hypothetical protein
VEEIIFGEFSHEAGDEVRRLSWHVMLDRLAPLPSRDMMFRSPITCTSVRVAMP